LQAAWNKYGPDVFTFEVLEYVLPMSLTAREQYWFEKLKPFDKKGFNLDRVAGSSLVVLSLKPAVKRVELPNLVDRVPALVGSPRLNNLSDIGSLIFQVERIVRKRSAIKAMLAEARSIVLKLSRRYA